MKMREVTFRHVLFYLEFVFTSVGLLATFSKSVISFELGFSSKQKNQHVFCTLSDSLKSIILALLYWAVIQAVGFILF